MSISLIVLEIGGNQIGFLSAQYYLLTSPERVNLHTHKREPQSLRCFVIVFLTQSQHILSRHSSIPPSSLRPKRRPHNTPFGLTPLLLPSFLLQLFIPFAHSFVCLSFFLFHILTFLFCASIPLNLFLPLPIKQWLAVVAFLHCSFLQGCRHFALPFSFLHLPAGRFNPATHTLSGPGQGSTIHT